MIRAYNSDGPRYDAIEWHRYGKFPVNNDYEASTKCHPPQHLEYKLATCIPAAVYLRNLIDCYRSLDRIPIVNPQQSDPTNDDKPSGPSSDPYNRYNEDVSFWVSPSQVVHTDSRARGRKRELRSRDCINSMDGQIIGDGRSFWKRGAK